MCWTFYCAAAKLAVELDGDQHGTEQGIAHDMARTRFLAAKGIRVMRFGNHEVKEDINVVVEGIFRALTPTRSATRIDLPLSGGGKLGRTHV